MNLRQKAAHTIRRTETMPKRFSAYNLVLVFSVGILVFFLSQRLSNSNVVERTPHVDIGRSIQSWASNEVEVNTTADIDDVVNEQREYIAEEMMGYPYPNGQYNINASKLEDLVMEKGGQPVRNVIVTTWRSGSTFLGDVLNNHPGNFYHYEPLLDYDIMQIRGEPLATPSLKALRQLLTCNYTGLDHYLNYGKDHIWLFTHNTRLWNQCQEHPHLCWNPEFLTKFCRLFPFQSMKTVRLRLKLAEELLDDPKLNIRVLLLVRDPRGTMQSRKHRDWCPGNPDCWDAARLCADLVADYRAAVRLKSLYPNRFRVMRYEDLSVEPHMGVQNLFKFFGLNFHPYVKTFLDTHTKVNVGGVSSTYRNSKSAPFHWRQDLMHSEVLRIQSVCRNAMDIWGYRRALNATHQREFNPMARYKLK